MINSEKVKKAEEALEEICDLIIELQNYIYENKIWTTIEKVYETRWDCRIRLGES